MIGKSRRTAAFAAFFLLIASAANPAKAFWLGFFSGAATVGAAALSAGTLAVAGGAAQVLGVGTHCVTGGDDFQPSFVTSATAAPFPVCSNPMLHANFPLYTLPGNAEDPLYQALNTAIAAANLMNADALAHASIAQILNDVHAVGSGLVAVAGQANALFAPATLTSAQFDSTAAQIGVSGLPASEAAFALSGGWTSADLNSQAAWDSSLTIDLNTPNVSVQTIILTLGQELQSVTSVPEPGDVVFLPAITLLLGWGLWRSGVARGLCQPDNVE